MTARSAGADVFWLATDLEATEVETVEADVEAVVATPTYRL